jgi:hypothetical protein
LHYANVDDYLLPGTVGDPEMPVLAPSAYHYANIVRDPVRPIVYGLDATKDVVVKLDTATLTPRAATHVAPSATDLEVDPNGAALYVGHLHALGLDRIPIPAFRNAKVLTTDIVPYDVAALGANMVAYIDNDQWMRPTLLDGTTGAKLSAAPSTRTDSRRSGSRRGVAALDARGADV